MNKHRIAILQGLADGVRITVLAKQLGSTESTLRNYLTTIREEFDADTTVAAVATALRRGLID